MDVYDAAKLAKTLMTQHRLFGWSFEFDRESRVFGSCDHSRRRIRLSSSLVELNPESEVRDTILHEIAHALVGAGHGHDRVWMAKCAVVGARPEATYDSDQVNLVPTKYIGVLEYDEWREAWGK